MSAESLKNAFDVGFVQGQAGPVTGAQVMAMTREIVEGLNAELANRLGKSPKRPFLEQWTMGFDNNYASTSLIRSDDWAACLKNIWDNLRPQLGYKPGQKIKAEHKKQYTRSVESDALRKVGEKCAVLHVRFNDTVDISIARQREIIPETTISISRNHPNFADELAKAMSTNLTRHILTPSEIQKLRQQAGTTISAKPAIEVAISG